MTAQPLRIMVKSAPADRREVAQILPQGNAPPGFEIVTINYGDARLTAEFLGDPRAFYLTAGAGFAIVRLDAANRTRAFQASAAAALQVELMQIRPAVGGLIGGQTAVTQRHIYAWLHGRISAVRNILASDSYSDAFRGAAIASVVAGPTEIGPANDTPLVERLAQLAKILSGVTASPQGARLFLDAQGRRTAFGASVQYGAAESDIAVLYDVPNWTVGNDSD